MFSRKNILELISFVSIGLLIYSCANRGYPTGGPKDITPPLIVKEEPANGSTNFSKKKLNIYFDEFVQLKDVATSFMISPPQKKKPKVKLRGTRVLVEFQDSLRDSTTYSLDFGSSIVDNNEGNPMGKYRYYFSTGDKIDTMRMGGNVFDFYSHKPIENAYVMLYEANSADSIPMLKMPLYVARTDTAGYFSLTNIKQMKYKIIAVDDTDRNYMFTSPTEKLAFSDSLFYPTSFPMTKRDTASKDSTALISYTAFGPENIRLFMFQEKPNQQYLVSSERKERGTLDFKFAIARKDSLKIDLLDFENDDVFIKEINSSYDTLKYWIKDTAVLKTNKLKAHLHYLKTDSLGKYVQTIDTLSFDFEDEEIVVRKDKDGEKKKRIDFLKLKFNSSGTLDVNTVLAFELDEPVLESMDDKISLYKIEKDTVKIKQNVHFVRDSMKIRKYTLDYKWIPEAKYSLEVDSAAIHSIYGKFNDKLVSKLSVKSEEDYGTIFVTIKNGAYPMIFNLVAKQSKDYKIIRTIYPDKDGQYTIKYVKPGKYSFQIISDTNGNKLWDTGSYLKHKQAEQVIYIDKIIEVRENWEYEESVDFKALEKE